MQSASPAFPPPQGGASLILTFRLQSKITLILGSNSLAASRAFSALEADSHVIIIAKGGLDNACEELRWRASQSQLTVLDWDALPGTSEASTDRDIKALESYLTTTNGITLVCVTDTVICGDASQTRTRASAAQIFRLCRSRNILVNVSDMPEFCDFSFASVHRFVDPESGQSTPLQIATTTNGQGCRLGGRIRREIVAKLPKEVGAAVEKMGKLRTMARASDEVVDSGLDSELNEDNGVTTPNLPVPIRGSMETSSEMALRRMKWVAQVSEYWPLPRLATMTEEDMQNVLSSEEMKAGSEVRHFLGGILSPSSKGVRSMHSFALPDSSVSNGKILLVGSGPGHPSLLTIATHNALTRHAHLVLSDKLVPAAVLALIPAEVEVRIARKFPGNADGAQIEMMEAAVEAARCGLTVVRLKQGDPVVYGRAGEEVLYFRAHGFEPIVIPGVSSALAAPTFAGIPVTQRGVAESFIVCTGVGRQGKDVMLPGYDRARTLVILMGVARLAQVLKALRDDVGDKEGPSSMRNGPTFPANTPIAIIERGSMPDQRIITSTLQNIAAALESVGEQRPPGMIVIGWSVLALWGKGDVRVLDEGPIRDDQRIGEWLGDASWRIKDGVDVGWNVL